MRKFILILIVFVMLISAASGRKRIKRGGSQKELAEAIDQLQVQIVTMTLQISNLLKQFTGRDLTVIYIHDFLFYVFKFPLNKI